MHNVMAYVPTEIGRAGIHDVKIVWQDGHISVHPARALRLQCPCAGCVDEVTGVRRLTDAGIPADVHPLDIHLTGRYGMAIRWSDGHNTGIYAFDRLRANCPCAACVHDQEKTAHGA